MTAAAAGAGAAAAGKSSLHLLLLGGPPRDATCCRRVWGDTGDGIPMKLTGVTSAPPGIGFGSLPLGARAHYYYLLLFISWASLGCVISAPCPTGMAVPGAGTACVC